MALGWRFGSRRSTSQALTRHGSRCARKSGTGRKLAERSQVRANQLAQENEAWTAGYKQGREDVIKIVPHIAAQRGLLGQSVASESDEMNNCA